MTGLITESLYIDIKRQICDLIYQGIYQEGDRIPAERFLAEQFKVSRVTIRKALELLEEEQLVVREVGSGTRVCFHNFGSAGSMDMITLVAPAKSPFFSQFIEYFQKHAARNNTLLLYVEKPEQESIENCLYRLYKKDLHNVVIWPDDLPVDSDKLKKLRALGMNMVFFDTDIAIPYADCVYLNNLEGIRMLTETVRSKGCSNLQYTGWDRMDVFSVRDRERAFTQTEKGIPTVMLPWKKEEDLEQSLKIMLQQIQKRISSIDALICGSGEIGIATAKILKQLKISGVTVAAIDEFASSKKYKITTYGQDFVEIARVIYDCLNNQNSIGRKWKADCYKISGILIAR